MTCKSGSSEEINYIEIDGSYLEGGGQILRISTALSVLLKKPIRIINIRAGRKDAGLKPQHLTGIELLKDISKAKLKGGVLKSTEISFKPNTLQSGRYLADTKTAGSIGLLIQSALPCVLFAKSPCELVLKGGTNAANAPQIDYFESVFCRVAKEFGIESSLEVKYRGYYPRGGGEVYLKSEPVKEALKPVNLTDFGKLTRITGRAFVAGSLPVKIAHKMADAAKDLFSKYNVPVDIQVVIEPQGTYFGAGTGIILFGETSTGRILAGSALGKKGLPAEQVAAEAAETLIHDLDCESCVDQYLQDQLIVFMALAKGKSAIKCGPLTLHTQTAIHYTQVLTGVKFDVTEQMKDKTYLIECEGMALENYSF